MENIAVLVESAHVVTICRKEHYDHIFLVSDIKPALSGLKYTCRTLQSNAMPKEYDFVVHTDTQWAEQHISGELINELSRQVAIIYKKENP